MEPCGSANPRRQKNTPSALGGRGAAKQGKSENVHTLRIKDQTAALADFVNALVLGVGVGQLHERIADLDMVVLVAAHEAGENDLARKPALFGQITYTFVISNTGNTEATATGNVVVTDTFAPILRNIAVTYNGTAWTEGTNYTYNAATGVFTTLAGQITVPAATFTQNTDGTFTVTPGTATLVITGTV